MTSLKTSQISGDSDIKMSESQQGPEICDVFSDVISRKRYKFVKSTWPV